MHNAGLSVDIACTTPSPFITFNPLTKSISMTPTTVGHLGSWNVTVTLTDAASLTAVYSFMVNVINLPPTYVPSSSKYSPISIHLNSV